MKAADFYVVEYGCDRHCRIEIDLHVYSPRTTRRQLRDAADADHLRQHPGLAGPQPLPPQKAGRPRTRGQVASPFKA